MKKFWKKSGMKHPGGGGGKDINHNAIADVFKSVGAVVVDTSMVGGGFADMLVIFRGTVHVVEIKNPNTAYGRAGLNKNQKKFHDSVKHQGGQIHIVSTEDEALAIIGATRTA